MSAPMTTVKNIADSFLSELDVEMPPTRRLLERVPGDKAAWKPHEKSFSMGHLAQLVARMPGWITHTMRQTALDLSGAPASSLEKTESLLAEFDRNVKEARETLAQAKDEDFHVPWSLKLGDQVLFTSPRLVVMRQNPPGSPPRAAHGLSAAGGRAPAFDLRADRRRALVAGRSLLRALAWLWASPGTLPGLACLILARCSGGGVRRIAGTLEAHGGALAPLLRWLGPRPGFAAITLGHVVLARDAASLDLFREHERVHVRQWERWGPLFPPAYLAASLWAWLRGRDAYRANHFERAAFGEPAPPHGNLPLR